MGSKNSTAALGNVVRDGLPDLAGKLRVGSRAPFPMSTLKIWYKKYVVLKGKRLEIFRNAREVYPEVVYDISNCQVENPKSHLDRVELEFGISSNQVTWLTFRAKDAGQRHIWVKALSHAVQKKQFYMADSNSSPLVAQNDGEESKDSQSSKRNEDDESAKEEQRVIPVRIRSHSSYDIVEVNRLMDVIRSKIDLVSSRLEMSPSRARLFLVETRWNVPKLLDTWKSSNERAKLLSQLKLEEMKEVSSPTSLSSSQSGKVKEEGEGEGEEEEEVECPICMDDYSRKDMIHPTHCSRSHSACRNCWKRHVETEIKEKGMCVVRCSHAKCWEPLTDKMIRELTDPEVYKTYINIMKTSYVVENTPIQFSTLPQTNEKKSRSHCSYVNRNENIIWCPNPKGCGRAAVYREGVSCDIRCSCGYEYCFKCRAAPHGTATCSHAKKWREMEKTIEDASKHSGDAVTLSDMTYLLENVKPCPRCKKPIERNHGCDHMTCRLGAGGCGHQFCWICLQPMKNHDSTMCATDKGDERMKKILGIQLKKVGVSKITKRFEAYFLRVLDRRKAYEFAKRSLEVISEAHNNDKNKTDEEEEKTSKLLSDALGLVMQAHHHLSWTYVQSFFLKSEVDLFSDVLHSVRAIVEERTERLHDLVESWKELFIRNLKSARKSKRLENSVFTNHVERIAAQSEHLNEALTLLRRTTEWINAERFFQNPKNVDEKEEEKEAEEEKEEEEEEMKLDEEDDDTTTPLPDGWRRVVDWSTGRAYYFNTKTRRSQWEKPWAGMMSADDFTSVQMRLMRDPTPWQCTRCTFINEAGGIMCSMCHNMRPLKPLENGDKKTDQWECAACTYMNPSANIQCAICFGMERREKSDKKDEEKEEENKETEEKESLETKSSSSTEESWICMLCEFENEYNVRRCVVCDTPSARRSGVIPDHVRKLLKTPEKHSRHRSKSDEKRIPTSPVRMKALETDIS